jgi:hypothetical protein
MKKTDKRIGIGVKDRKLGDEWQNWQGDLNRDEKDASTGKRTFLLLLYVTILFLAGLSFFTWYMISPRLSQFHPNLPYFLAVGIMLCWAVFSIYFFLIVLSIKTQKDFSLHLGKFEIPLTRLVPLVLKIGVELGISVDRMANSFVKVRNAIIKTSAINVGPERLLILLPRCLEKTILQRITQFAIQNKIHLAVVAGGEKARQEVARLHPLAVIGVACERDLLSGIQDVSGKIQVIGIPNIRPEGPCKNTQIDFKEFETAVQTFLGKTIQISM